MSAFVDAPAASERLVDEVVREIGEQVSKALIEKLPKWGSTPLDLKRGLSLYENRVQTFGDIREVGVSSGQNQNKKIGNQFEVLYASQRREEGAKGWTTDELAKWDDGHPIFEKYPQLKGYAKTNHQQTDYVEIGPNGELIRSQLKLYEDVGDGVTAFLEDEKNEKFVVPNDQYGHYEEKLTERIAKTTDKDERQKLQHIKKNLQRSAIKLDDARRAARFVATKTAVDVSKRAVASIGIGVVTEVVVFACGGAAWEIRDAYRNPETMPVLERCKRLIAAIWDKIKTSLKDRSLREIGAGVIEVLASVFNNMVKATAKKVQEMVNILRRLWADFVDKRIKSVSDLITACLKAVVALSIVGVVAVLQAELGQMLSGIPGADVLIAVAAAVVAGVMIILANRSIDGVIQGLLSIFHAGAVARMRREEIDRICEEALPQLVADRERLQVLADGSLVQRGSLLCATIEDIQSTKDNGDFNGFLRGLDKINQEYGKLLPWKSFDELDEIMLDDKRTLKLTPRG